MNTTTIDRKFKFLAINPCNKKIYDEENAVVFVAKDKALIPTLMAYQEECKKLGCESEHIKSIGLLIERVANFQTTECDIPDTILKCEIDRCIDGKL